MRLVPDWRRVLLRAYSVRFIILAGVFSGAEVVLQIFGETLPLPDGVRAAIYFVNTLLALVFRVVAQPSANLGDKS